MPFTLCGDVSGRLPPCKLEFVANRDLRVSARIALGFPITEAEWAAFPRVMTATIKRVDDLYDFFFFNGLIMVSETVRSILTTLKEEHIMLVPIEIRTSQGASRPYYLLTCPPKLDAVIVELTDFQKGRGQESMSLQYGGRCVMRANVIKDHHLWLGTGRLDLQWFCSDAFARNCKEQDVTRGAEFRDRCIPQ
jgi:hypothetical protein